MDMTTTVESAARGELQPVSFVHISDPHMTSLTSVDWRSLLNKRLLGYLSWRHKRRAEHHVEVLQALNRDLGQRDFDQLLITGDLTHIALPQEFRQAQAWLESLGGPQKVFVVPGNHDAYVNVDESEGLARWAPYFASDSDWTGVRGGFPSLRLRGQVAFIGLSSAVPTPPLLATGVVGDAQRRRFAEMLRWCGARGLFRVVTIHHPPLPGLERWRKRLTDAVAVRDLIVGCGAELVLHGHCHKPLAHHIAREDGQGIPVRGAPSALSNSRDPDRVARYYYYQVAMQDDGWKLTVDGYRYAHEQGAFVPGESNRFELSRPLERAA